MSIPPILDQKWYWACASVAMLGALVRMKPDIDHESILKEVLKDKSAHLTYQRASAWFQARGLIKWIKPVKYSPFLAKKTPILTGVTNADWKLTGSPPYVLKFENRQTLGSHFICIVWANKIVNSWGSEWGDKWYFYFEQKDIRRFKQCFVLII